MAVLGSQVLAAVVPARYVWVHVAGYVMGSLVVGAVMSAVLENPVIRLRDRWLPRRADPIAPPAGLPAPAAGVRMTA